MNKILFKLLGVILLGTLTCNPLSATELSDAEQTELRKQLDQQRQQLELSRKQMEAAANSMKEASRKLAETRRKLNLEMPGNYFVFSSSEFEYSASGNGYVGIVINQNSDAGKLEIIGLTPDGPALKAGLRKGDEVLSINGTDLLTLPASERLQVLLDNLGKTTPDTPISLTVLRNEEPLTVSLIAQERKPGSLHVLLRPPHPDRPPAPPYPLEHISQLDLDQSQTITTTTNDSGSVTVINRSIEVSDLDGSKKILMQIETPDGEFSSFNPETMEIHIKNLENRLENMDFDIDMSDFPGKIDMDNFEVIVGTVKDNAFAWFDRNMLKGLEMSSMNPELGVFFQADSGVLILKADPDNTLNLKTGDVIIAVDGQTVSRPAEIMRKIRFLKDGDTIDLELIRDGQAETVRSQPVDKFSQSSLYRQLDKSPLSAATLHRFFKQTN